MENPSWTLYVVPIVNLFLLLGGIARIVWLSGQLAQQVKDLQSWQKHLADEADETSKQVAVLSSQVSKIMGALGMNGSHITRST